MPKFDPERKPSQKTVELALERYKDLDSDIKYSHVALLVARGEPVWKAYRAAFPEASRTTCESQGSVLCAHPRMRAMITDHRITARSLLEAALPRVVRKHVDLIDSDHDAVALRAVTTIEDRAGLPPRAELAIHATVIGASLYQDAIASADTIEAELLEDPQEKHKGPQRALTGPLSPTQARNSIEAIEAQRPAWAELEPD